jgi:hypothetical protein
MASAKFFVFILALLALAFSITLVSAEDWKQMIINKVTGIICSFFRTFYYIAGAIASLVIVIAGVKWAASENDPGARKQAKDAIIHAIIGLILVILVSQLVKQVIGTEGCTGGPTLGGPGGTTPGGPTTTRASSTPTLAVGCGETCGITMAGGQGMVHAVCTADPSCPLCLNNKCSGAAGGMKPDGAFCADRMECKSRICTYWPDKGDTFCGNPS